MAQIPGIISSIGGSAAGTARAVGQNIGAALASGIRSQIGAVQAAAAAIVAAADVAMRAKAVISSPSKLFTKRGEQMGIAPAIGIRNMIPAAVQAIRDFVGNMDRELERAMAGAASFIQPVTAGINTQGGMMMQAPAPAVASGNTYILNVGDISVTESQDGRETADQVITRIKRAWGRTGAIS